MIPSAAIRGPADAERAASANNTARAMLAIVRRARTQAWGITVREVALDTGCAISIAHLAVKALEAEGLVSYDPATARSLRPLVTSVGTP